MHPLNLTMGVDSWRLYARRKVDPAFRPFRDKVLTRDGYTCQFCGFQARDYQEVINLDQNYRHNTMSNVVTACCFCAQCFFIGMVGEGDFGGGRLIYLPELTQTELNGFCHVIFCAMTNQTNYRDIAQEVYRTLKFRSQVVEEKFGAEMSNPAMMTRMLMEYQGKQEHIEKKVLKNLRLLPSYPRFKKQLLHWAKTAADELSSAG